MAMNIAETDYLPVSVSSRFSEIDREITMLYSTGSVEVKEGLYIDEDGLSAWEKHFENYDFEG